MGLNYSETNITQNADYEAYVSGFKKASEEYRKGLDEIPQYMYGLLVGTNPVFARGYYDFWRKVKIS